MGLVIPAADWKVWLRWANKEEKIWGEWKSHFSSDTSSKTLKSPRILWQKPYNSKIIWLFSDLLEYLSRNAPGTIVPLMHLDWISHFRLKFHGLSSRLSVPSWKASVNGKMHLLKHTLFILVYLLGNSGTKKSESQFTHLHHKVMFLSVFDFTLECFKFYTFPDRISVDWVLWSYWNFLQTGASDCIVKW